MTVTIVTPTRNRPPMLERALASIARQTFDDYEVIVVDDGSSEPHAQGYRDLVARFGPRFKLLQALKPGESGSGPAQARNRGIFAGTGTFVAFLDDDDEWIWDDYLKSAVRALETEGLDLHCCNMQAVRGDQLVYESWLPDLKGLLGAQVQSDPPTHVLTRAAFVNAARHRVIHPNMLMIRRDLVNRTKGFLVSLRFAEDTEFVLRLADSIDRMLLCVRPVARYRLPEGNSHSLSLTPIEQELQTLAAAQQLTVRAVTPEVQEAGTRIESWTLRTLSAYKKKEGQRGAAVRLALQAFVVRPGLGSAAQIAKAIF